jgi:3',5'-cyclic AMP phosphodiesterase CpdA
MKIVGISDLHGWLPDNLPEGNVLCIAGDIVPLEIQRSFTKTRFWLANQFLCWIDQLKFSHIIIVPGNHDFYIEELYKRNELENFGDDFNNSVRPQVHWIVDDKIEIYGTTFYGCAWTLENEYSGPGAWAFEAEKKHGNLYDQKYSGIIRANVDVIITHDSPRHNHAFNLKGVDEWQLWLHGHWHDDEDIVLADVYNVAVLKNNYSPKGGGFKVFNINQEDDDVCKNRQQGQIADKGNTVAGNTAEQEERRIPPTGDSTRLQEREGSNTTTLGEGQPLCA